MSRRRDRPLKEADSVPGYGRLAHGKDGAFMGIGKLTGLGALSLAVAACHDSGDAGPLRVAAAADLAFAFKDVGEAFTRKTGTQVTFSFGSTGLLEKQIEEGAPFDVFAAANVSFADAAVSAGACLADSKSLYARGRIVLWSRAGPPPASLASLKDSGVAKIAIANPEHAPYGKAAQQALERAGIWADVKSKLVYGENVQETLQFAQSGNADVAIVALSLATVSKGAFTPIDAAGYDPIDQAMVVCKGERGRGAHLDKARAFTAFVASDEARSIMRRYGFLMPGEAPAAAASSSAPAPSAAASAR
jgi:molybdate transport system substrate-binding protein